MITTMFGTGTTSEKNWYVWRVAKSMPEPVTVYCAICREKLPIDFFECPKCGTHNPQLHMVRRERLTVMVDIAVYKALEKLSIVKGRPMDDLVNEAIEDYITRLNDRRRRG